MQTRRSIALFFALMLGTSSLSGCPATEDDCSDGVDNDSDGLVDCEDVDCSDDPSCSAADDDDSAR